MDPPEVYPLMTEAAVVEHLDRKDPPVLVVRNPFEGGRIIRYQLNCGIVFLVSLIHTSSIIEVPLLTGRILEERFNLVHVEGSHLDMNREMTYYEVYLEPVAKNRNKTVIFSASYRKWLEEFISDMSDWNLIDVQRVRKQNHEFR